MDCLKVIFRLKNGLDQNISWQQKCLEFDFSNDTELGKKDKKSSFEKKYFKSLDFFFFMRITYLKNY